MTGRYLRLHDVSNHGSRRLQSRLRSEALTAFDQIAEVAKFAVTTIDRQDSADEASPINEGHALARPPSRVWDVVLADTLFGRLAVSSVIASEIR